MPACGTACRCRSPPVWMRNSLARTTAAIRDDRRIGVPKCPRDEGQARAQAASSHIPNEARSPSATPGPLKSTSSARSRRNRSVSCCLAQKTRVTHGSHPAATRDHHPRHVKAALPARAADGTPPLAGTPPPSPAPLADTHGGDAAKAARAISRAGGLQATPEESSTGVSLKTQSTSAHAGSARGADGHAQSPATGAGVYVPASTTFSHVTATVEGVGRAHVQDIFE
ncbi:MAG: hypothetical protein WDW38_005656 [Sanguina aurantia]